MKVLGSFELVVWTAESAVADPREANAGGLAREMSINCTSDKAERLEGLTQ